MLTGIAKVWRPGLFALGAVVLVSVGSGQAVGQSTFDPYNPSTGQYQEFVTPSFPANLALPGQARQAYDIQQETTYGDRASNGTAFERFLRDGYEDRFSAAGVSLNDLGRGRSAGTGAGVPYFAGSRASSRAYAPNQQADRDFTAIRRERERRYFDAVRERDPVKRAKLLRKVNEPIDPKDLPAEDEENAGRSGDDRSQANAAPTSEFRIARSRDLAPSQIGRERETAPAYSTTPDPTLRNKPTFRMPLAGESLGLATEKPKSLDAEEDPLDLMPSRLPAPRPAGGSGPPTPPSRRRLNAGPERRPLMPSEIIDRNRASGTSGTTRPGTAPRSPGSPLAPR